jgi:hypothetical protein
LTESESEEARIDEFVSRPSFQLTFRHALCAAHKMKEASNPNELIAILFQFVNERGFLFKYSMDYGFFRTVKKNEAKTALYWNKLRELSYLVLLDLLHPDKATPSNAEKKLKQVQTKTNGFENSWVPIKNFQRIRRTYPEVFFNPNKLTSNSKSYKRRHPDRRPKRYSTIFSEMPNVNKTDRNQAFLLMMLEDIAVFSKLEDLRDREEFISNLWIVDPEDLASREKFFELLKHCLEVITGNYGQPTANLWLIPHIKNRWQTKIVVALYHYIDTAIALRIAKTIKSNDKIWRLASEKYEIHYSSEDAKKTVDLLVKLTDNPIEILNAVFNGAMSYALMGNYEAALCLYSECFKKTRVDGKLLGLYYRNLGGIYREKKMYKKSIGYIEKALDIYKKLKSPYDEAITWSCIALPYFQIGKKQEFTKAVLQSKKLLLSANENESELAKAFLWFADCARNIGDREWERESVIFGFRSGAKVDDAEYADYFWHRLTILNGRYQHLTEEQMIRKLKRPLGSDTF